MPVRLRKTALPYLLLLPGLGWLLLFFAIPLVYMAVESLKSSGELEQITDQWMGGQAGAPELQ